MATEEQIKELAFRLWEQEGRPEGKDVEHYFRAKHILERGGPSVIELPPTPAPAQLAPPKKANRTRRSK